MSMAQEYKVHVYRMNPRTYTLKQIQEYKTIENWEVIRIGFSSSYAT